jgi:hypothetical protein
MTKNNCLHVRLEHVYDLDLAKFFSSFSFFTCAPNTIQAPLLIKYRPFIFKIFVYCNKYVSYCRRSIAVITLNHSVSLLRGILKIFTSLKIMQSADRPVDLVLIYRSQITSDSVFGETVMDGIRLY